MARIGETTCWNPDCKAEGIAVNRTAGGKLHAQCHRCGCGFWPNPGSKSARYLVAQTTLDDDAPASTPAPAPEPAPRKQAAQAPAPTPPIKARANDPFSLGAL